MAKVWKKLQRADSDYTGNVTGKVGGTDASDVKDGAVAGTAAKTITDAAFDSNTKLKTANAADGLLNSQVAIAKDSSGNISLTNAASGSIALDNSDVGLGNVTNDAQIKSDGSNAPNSLLNSQITVAKDSSGNISLNNAGSGSIALDNSDVGLSNVTNHAQIKSDGSNAPATLTNSSITLTASGGTVTLNNAGSGSFDKSDVGLGNVDNESKASILGGTLTGAVANTATVGGTAASTVASGAADGATAKGITDDAFDTSGSDPILNVANAAAGLKNSGISINANGTLTGAGSGQVTAAGVNAIGTDGTGAPNSLKNNQITLTASGGTVTMNNAGGGSFGKSEVGLGSVVNQKVAVVSGKIQLDDVDQTIDADKIGGKTRAETEAAAVTTATSNIVGTSPGVLDTLTKISTSLGNQSNAYSSLTTSIGTKAKAPMTLTAEDVDGDTAYDNDPANEVVGQIGVVGGQQYVVVDE